MQGQTDYKYFSVGSEYAVKPHTNKPILSILATAGVTYGYNFVWDISVNYQYTNLTPKYHSYFAQVQVIPFTYKGIEFLVGGKYGRVIRTESQSGTYLLYGGNGEIRYGKKWFVSLMGSYDFRGDIAYWWGEDYWVYSTHIKVGIKI